MPSAVRAADSVNGNRPGSGPRDAIATFMHGGSPAAVPAQTLIDGGLAGYAVARAAAAGVALDGRVKAARVALAGRHLATKRLVADLLGAWLDEGIEVLVFKGFALAEFVYSDPTWRTYSDVDVVLSAPADGDWAAQTTRAAAVAAARGFKVYGRPEYSDEFDSLHGESYVGPTILHLVHRQTGTNIDVHRRVIHNGHDESRRVALQERITSAVWRDSRSVSLAGVPIRIPSNVDSALVGLILHRTWSTDSSRLRPQDYLDLATLASRFEGVDALKRRADELGCSATLRLFLRRCDPETRTLDLRPPNALTRFWYDVLLTPEHGSRTLLVRGHELRHLPKRSLRTFLELSNVAMHLRRWRASPPPTWPAEELPDGTSPLDRETWRLTQFAVRRAFQLNGVAHPERRPEVARAALLYSLRRRGVPVKRVVREAARTDDPDAERSVLMLHGVELRPVGLGIRQ
jgi:hypothetical protein